MEHEFLKEKYGLHKSPEVEKAAKRTEQRTGEKVPQNPEARIQNYLDRLERLALDPEKKQKREMFGNEPRPRALMLLREMIMNKYVRPHKEKMAEGAARIEERAAREMGIEARYGEQELEQRGEIAVEDLEKSLDQWIFYLSDANEPYPTWFRYYVFRNVLDLGDYDKDKREFTKRSPGSVRLFPDIDRGALAYVQQMMEAAKDPAMLERLQRAQRVAANQDIPANELITKEKAVNFAKLSFAKQYAEGIKQAGEIKPEMRKETSGEWVKYQKGTDPTALWASLQNKGTAWCTKGFATAETQLKGGDFYVYYTLDRQGKPTIPRIAIRMQEDQIGEVRGVADNDQNLEGNMAAIAEEKMKELPGAEKYRKASADMKALTAIEKKTACGETLTRNDLVFLYELDALIEGFGYQRDPRIAELRNRRNPVEDMPIVFECSEDQIVHDISEIKEGTEAYIGPLVPGIFDKIQEYGIEHIYTSFPEGRIRKETVEIGGRDYREFLWELGQKKININFSKWENVRDALEKIKNKKISSETMKFLEELVQKKINITEYATDMLKSKDFVVLEEAEEAILVRLKVRDLGIGKQYPTTDDIYKRIGELGLELCPAEVGPNYRLQYQNQPMGEWFWVGMKQITDRGGIPDVFYLERDEGGVWLRVNWAVSTREWGPGSGLVFRLRKLKNLET